MTKRNKAMEQEVTEDSRSGMGLFALIAVLTILGVVIWFVVNSSDETT